MTMEKQFIVDFFLNKFLIFYVKFDFFFSHLVSCVKFMKKILIQHNSKGFFCTYFLLQENSY